MVASAVCLDRQLDVRIGEIGARDQPIAVSNLELAHGQGQSFLAERAEQPRFELTLGDPRPSTLVYEAAKTADAWSIAGIETLRQPRQLGQVPP